MQTFIGSLDLGALPSAVSDIPPDLWQSPSWLRAYSHDAQVIALRMPSIINEATLRDDIAPTYCVEALGHLAASWPATGALLSTLDAAMARLPMATLGRVTLLKVKPGGSIKAQPQDGEYARHFRHVRIAIKADPETQRTAQGSFRCVFPGELWRYDTPPATTNGSNKDKVYLTMDYA